MRYVGRMGLQITEKRTGDMVWNSRAQKWGEVELMWAIHSLWAPPTETDDQGRYSFNGRGLDQGKVPHTR